ncbi:TPA: hypothetical protein KV183_003378 [Morganella morganii]|nr:hypothetical protein [Morganella morganii]
MKYYLETNALRALGGNIGKNIELLKKSYTSIFSIFELIKGINRTKDSEKRLGILNSISDIDLQYIDLMPTEMAEMAFSDGACISDSETIKKILSGDRLAQDDYDKIIEKYESSDKIFQKNVTIAYAIPAPPPKKITLTLDEIFPIESEAPDYLNSIPKDAHPSRFMMEFLKQTEVPELYRNLFPDSKINDQEILGKYNNSLNLFFFTSYAYDLKRRALRQAASKNDLLDVLHTMYLIDEKSIIVTDDTMLLSIIPPIYTMTVNEYRNMIEGTTVEN